MYCRWLTRRIQLTIHHTISRTLFASVAFVLAAASLQAQLQFAGTMYVDLRATNVTAGGPLWINQGALGSFTAVGAPVLTTNVAGTGVPGVFFDGLTNNAYQGPASVADIDGADDRSIEVWA